jgi:RimJ/RimL family protein N-acetyltransferase
MPDCNLFTGRLVRLAAPLAEDAQFFSQSTHDPDYMRQLDTDYAMPRAPHEISEQLARFRGDSRSAVFHLRTLSDDRLIGFVAIHDIEWNNQAGVLSIGIGDADYRAKGYGSDALNLALNYAFSELSLYRVGLDVIASNTRAIRSYEKAGFQHEGVKRAYVYRDGQRVDLILMSILRPEWEQRTKNQE